MDNGNNIDTPGKTPAPAEQYAMDLALCVMDSFNHVSENRPAIMHPESDDPAEESVGVKLTLTNVFPVDGEHAVFTVMASGRKWPLSYMFKSQANGFAPYHVVPASPKFIMPHTDQPDAFYGYALGTGQAGWDENFAYELVGNYLTDLRNMGYGDLPDRRTVEAQLARLLPN